LGFKAFRPSGEFGGQVESGSTLHQ
jgi:hypothetical protein